MTLLKVYKSKTSKTASRFYTTLIFNAGEDCVVEF